MVMDISMDIHVKFVDMDMKIDVKFYIHGKPVKLRDPLTTDVIPKRFRHEAASKSRYKHQLLLQAASNAWDVDYCDRCSLRMSVCLSRGFAVQIRLNGSRSCLG